MCCNKVRNNINEKFKDKRVDQNRVSSLYWKQGVSKDMHKNG